MKRVLFCVLNWGLGHATRSTPLIDELLSQDCQVQIASDGLAADFLMKRYPRLVFHDLPGYDAQYKTSSVFINSLRVLPSMHRAIVDEKMTVADIVAHWSPDMIISDNRYGCYHSSAHSILLSHQLRLPAPNVFAKALADFILNKKLKPFDELWVPDMLPPNHMTGSMSQLIDSRVRHIGFLSAMSIQPVEVLKKNLLYLLSGPEPARTKFETRLLKLNLNNLYQINLIRGTETINSNIQNDINAIDLATVDQVNHAILSSDLIVCRPGYTTVMDLLTLGKKAIYVPTPGQPEQKLLSNQLNKLKLGVVVREKELTDSMLQEAIQKLIALPAVKRHRNDEFIEVVVELMNKF